MKRLFYILTASILISFTACKDYYNETIQWTSEIKRGTDIETVKQMQPNFLEIAWERPDTMDNQILYEITKIKGNKDILKMQHFLIFVDKKYEGRTTLK